MMRFVVEGVMDLGRERRRFVKELDAPNERVARELVYKKLGSAHGLPRTRITISAVRRVEE